MGVYDGMTINERLFEAKLLEQFDDAVRQRNKEKMIEILKSVDLTDTDAMACSETVLNNPRKYGY